MNRLSRLLGIVRSAAVEAQSSQISDFQGSIGSNAAKLFAAKFWTSPVSAAGTVTGVDADELEHATGVERQELEAKAKGIDLFHESWLDQPFGTESNPVEVPSEYESRIVGVPDPDDDSIVWWGVIEAGQPPKQIIEDGEFFVLKQLPTSGGGH